MAPILQCQSVSYTLDGATLIAGAELAVETGTFLGVIGPNGAGKSTLLRLAAGLIAPSSGEITLDGRSLRAQPRKQIARLLGYVPQQVRLDFPFSVADVVMDGRNPHLGRFQIGEVTDRQIVWEAMEQTGILPLAERNVQTLSGGEKQRVLIARALAQQPRVLLLDEPTANLDLYHQHAIVRLVRRLAAEQGLAVVAAIHDINLAARYCDQLAVLMSGRIVATGPPAMTLTRALLAGVFAVEAEITPEPDVAGAVRVHVLNPSDTSVPEAAWEATHGS
jgi:iron complex transport system ATP-binding protein